MRNESDLRIAFGKARQDFAAVQALLTIQNDTVDPHTTSLNSPNHHTHLEDIMTQAPNQLAVAIELIANLVWNGAKYSPADKSVRLSFACKQKVCILTVADEGISIPEADLKHKFEPFHSAVNFGTISGKGLGLIISPRAVELHGGTIAIQSKVGTGTAITIEIPLDTQKDNDRGENSGD